MESTIEMLTPKDVQGILGCGINQVYTYSTHEDSPQFVSTSASTSRNLPSNIGSRIMREENLR